MPLLEINKLTMRFGGLTAVSKVDLAVDEGKIYSVIGPNGAGKTTVFNAMTGIYEPTEGIVLFSGTRLRRPFTWMVIVACLLVGLATGIAAALFMGNIDKLWHAAVRRNFDNPARPFGYGSIVRDAFSYLGGPLDTERRPDGNYFVVTADGSREFAKVKTADEAKQLRDDLEALVARERQQPDTIKKQVVAVDGSFKLQSLGDTPRDLLTFVSQEKADVVVKWLTDISADRARFTTTLVLSFLIGGLVGAAGAFVIWQRSRSTPDVISRGGLARTFQNIRLFRDLTVLENVLIGMDRLHKVNIFASVLRLPAARQEEREQVRKAVALLDFVGLKRDANDLAKNLPYGDQRRLEIARALATEPKLILLDEPAAGMNPAESDTLMGLVRRIRDRGITVVLIEHHMKLVMSISDRIAVLDHGEKIAEGTPAEVKANPKVVEAYLGKEEVH